MLCTLPHGLLRAHPDFIAPASMWRVMMALYMDRHPAPPSIRVMIVDGHGILRDGLSLLLERHDRMKVVGTATNGKDAVALTTMQLADYGVHTSSGACP